MRETMRRVVFSGINNVGLMARALALKGNVRPDEEEHVRWQTTQVSTLSVASCIGRILIGDFLHRLLRNPTGLNILPLRNNSRLRKSQGD